MSQLILPATDRDQAIKRLNRFLVSCFPGKKVRVEVSVYQAPRSDAQNHALFGVAYPPLMEFMGLQGNEEKEELHRVLCGEFWGWTVYEVMGHKRKKPKRTTTRDENGQRQVIGKTLFAEFYAFVQRKGAELGVCLPDPDPEWFLRDRDPR